MKYLHYFDFFQQNFQVHARKEVAQKLGKKWNEAQSRAPLDLCIDPQFEIYRPFIKQVKPKKFGKNPYEETDPNTILDTWGAELPARVDSWNSGRAEIRSRFIKSKLNELTENTEERNVDFSHTDSELKFISDKQIVLLMVVDLIILFVL